MKPKLYVETTLPSYLTSRRSRDLIIAGHQQITREWWHKRRGAFQLYISQLVASSILASGSIPRKAATDAAHIAIAAVHGMEFLITWNCVHIANAVIAKALARICRQHGFECPVI